MPLQKEREGDVFHSGMDSRAIPRLGSPGSTERTTRSPAMATVTNWSTSRRQTSFGEETKRAKALSWRASQAAPWSPIVLPAWWLGSVRFRICAVRLPRSLEADRTRHRRKGLRFVARGSLPRLWATNGFMALIGEIIIFTHAHEMKECQIESLEE